MSIQQTEQYVNRILDTLLKAPPGNRNNALNTAAYSVGGLISGGYLSRDEGQEKLFLCATTLGLSDKEAIATIQSGLNAGELAPLELKQAPADNQLSQEQKREIEERTQRIQVSKRDRIKAALDKLGTNRPDLAYYHSLNGKSQTVKKRWGLTDDSIDLFKIGYCEACPTSTYSPSFTIPYYWNEKLINVRHRLITPNGSGKYRPEMTGLPSMLFNTAVLDGGWIILVEGEFKAIVLQQYGFPAVAIPGASNYNLVKKTLKLFSRSERVYVALDPGAEIEAAKIGGILAGAKIDTRLVTLPVKPDDFFVVYGGTASQFSNFVQQGKKI
jgi:hypothetical protein